MWNIFDGILVAMWLVEVALRDFIQLEPGILRTLVAEPFSWLQFVVFDSQKTVKWRESQANMHHVFFLFLFFFVAK